MLLADAQILVLGRSVLDCHGLELVLRHELRCGCVDTCGFEPTAVWNAARKAVHVALISCDDADPAIIDAVQMLPRLKPQARLVLLTASAEPVVLSAWLSGPLDGIIQKSGGIQALGEGLETVLKGQRYFPRSVEARLPPRSNGHRPSRVALSRRETELLPLLARGLKLQEAADSMRISYKTAGSYRTSLLRKLGLRDRVELARYAIRERIVQP
jgi:DNA-binding NarL/FixJ family response regulator